MNLSDDDIDTLLDLGLLDDSMELAEALSVQPPPEEPEPPSIDSPPGEWTEYSDKPPAFRLLRLSRTVFTAEEAAVLSETLCKQWGVRKSGEGFYDLRYWTWRVVDV